MGMSVVGASLWVAGARLHHWYPPHWIQAVYTESPDIPYPIKPGGGQEGALGQAAEAQLRQHT